MHPIREQNGNSIQVLDQRLLPFRIVERELRSVDDVVGAIRDMVVRGAPLIGVTAAYGLWLAAREHGPGQALRDAAERLLESRPTAVNLAWAVGKGVAAIEGIGDPENVERTLFAVARQIAESEREACGMIGEHGVVLIEEMARRNGGRVNILTHCNAGWLACTGYGTATAPIYRAHERGIDLHVWVDETRPRNQGSRLTAWELAQAGIPYTVIADNTGGHLMQRGMVDLCIVGCDRATRHGDICNKIGTYLKALAAHDNGIPFYVALPTSTIDMSIEDGISQIPIEERSGDEVRLMEGLDDNGELRTVAIMPPDAPVANYAFDITPSRLVTALITERGVERMKHC